MRDYRYYPVQQEQRYEDDDVPTFDMLTEYWSDWVEDRDLALAEMLNDMKKYRISPEVLFEMELIIGSATSNKDLRERLERWVNVE